eukprot:90456_1
MRQKEQRKNNNGQFTMTKLLANGISNWLINGIVWLIPYCLWTIGCTYYVYTVYFIYRRYKYGTITTGQITKKCITVSNNDTNETIEYYLHFTFEDKRAEITDKYLLKILNKFTQDIDNYIPNDIIQLCMQYIGDSFIFYYGPYRSMQQVTHFTYNQVTEGENIKLKYDIKYPQNVEIYDNNKDYINYFFILIMPIFCISVVCIGIIYGLIVTIEYNNNQWIGMIFIIMSSIFITIVVITSCCFKKKYFCFKRNPQLKFMHVDRLDSDDTDIVSDDRNSIDMYCIPMVENDEETSDDESII